MQNPNENLSLSEGINDFVQKNRKAIFVSLGVIVLMLAGFIAAVSLMDMLRQKAISAAEELSGRYESLRFTITEEASAADVEALLTDLEAFAKKHSGYAGGRAWALAAGIRSDKKEWEQAETAWASAAETAAKTYLGPAAWFNAGIAAEEQGKTAEALEYYAKSLSTAIAFPAAPRAQFSIGRLKEALQDNAAAIEAYRALITNWPYDTVWTNLAHSRIAALEPKTADSGAGEAAAGEAE
jgi:tetratricopeptide (TPR) repeat protein